MISDLWESELKVYKTYLVGAAWGSVALVGEDPLGKGLPCASQCSGTGMDLRTPLKHGYVTGTTA